MFPKKNRENERRKNKLEKDKVEKVEKGKKLFGDLLWPKMANQPVNVVTLDQKKLEGVIRAITKYEIHLEQVVDGKRTGELFILFKHSLKYIRCSSRGRKAVKGK